MAKVQKILEQEMTDGRGLAKAGEVQPGGGIAQAAASAAVWFPGWENSSSKVPQERRGHFSTQIVERDQRSEKALV